MLPDGQKKDLHGCYSNFTVCDACRWSEKLCFSNMLPFFSLYLDPKRGHPYTKKKTSEKGINDGETEKRKKRKTPN